MTGLVCSFGTGSLSVEPFSISSSTVACSRSSSSWSPSFQAMTRLRSVPDLSISSVNSSS